MLPECLEVHICKLAVLLELKDKYRQRIFKQPVLDEYLRPEEVHEFVQINIAERKEALSLHYRETRDHGIEVMYKRCLNIKETTHSLNYLKACLSVNNVEGRSKLKRKRDIINALIKIKP